MLDKKLKKAAIIIDSGQMNRSLDASRSQPKSLDKVKNLAVLEWSLHALKAYGINDVTYIGSYHIEKVLERFPQLQFRFHANHLEEGELAALCLYNPNDYDELVIFRGETLLLPQVFDLINNQNQVAGFLENSSCAKFSGFLRFCDSMISRVFDSARLLLKGSAQATFDDLLNNLTPDNLIERIILDGYVAPVSNQHAIARTVFQGKGKTLAHLAPLIQKAVVQDQYRFTVSDWQNDRNKILQSIFTRYANDIILIRSCTSAEDRLHHSAAGAFLSLLDIPGHDINEIQHAIDAVILSYRKNNREFCAFDEILVQKQVTDIAASGVLLTRDPLSGAPYYILSLDRNSGRSDTVTGGKENSLENYYIAWNNGALRANDSLIDSVILLADELVSLSHIDSLDIEFAVGKTGIVYLFQVRPLTLQQKRIDFRDDDVFDVLQHASIFVQQRMLGIEALCGDTTVLSVMSDWNPAEMIGINPRPLALSLYQKLIGESNWATARARMGYKNIVPFSLVLSIAGSPYVDIRASLNSLLPKNTSKEFASKWVNFCINRLKNNKYLHDKIEFEVASTCLTPDWKRYADILEADGFEKSEIDNYKTDLGALTEQIINTSDQLFKNCFDQVDHLVSRMEDASGELYQLALKIACVVKDIEQYGIIPFASLARCAFISMSFLRGLRNEEVITPALFDDFLNAIPTVASDFSYDSALYSQKKITLESMLSKYGHLRPNSYEITSENYRSNPQQYFRSVSMSINKDEENLQSAESILLPYTKMIQESLCKLSLNVSAEKLIDFMVKSISAREFSKFQFMKNIDYALELISQLGNRIGIDKKDLAYLSIDEILKLETNSLSSATIQQLRRSISFNKKKWKLTSSLRLPDLICSPEEVTGYQQHEWKSNFITRKRVVAEPIWLDEISPPYNLDGKIVIIRAADPGYDWIFGHKIVGLITEYGGTASHMAIRAGEFGIPAAIGSGAKLIDTLRTARVIEIDCENESVRII